MKQSQNLSQGCVALRAALASHGGAVGLARKLGVSEKSVRRHAGGASPDERSRSRYASTLDIPIDAWAPNIPTTDETPTTNASPLAAVDRALDRKDVTARDRLRYLATRLKLARREARRKDVLLSWVDPEEFETWRTAFCNTFKPGLEASAELDAEIARTLEAEHAENRTDPFTLVLETRAAVAEILAAPSADLLDSVRASAISLQSACDQALADLTASHDRDSKSRLEGLQMRLGKIVSKHLPANSLKRTGNLSKEATDFFEARDNGLPRPPTTEYDAMMVATLTTKEVATPTQLAPPEFNPNYPLYRKMCAEHGWIPRDETK